MLIPSSWNHIFQNEDDIIILLYVNWPSMPQFQLEILLNSEDVIHEALRAD